MPRNKPLVVVTRKLPEVIETRMMELFDTKLNHDDTPMDRDALQAAMAEADVLVPTVTDRIDAGMIAQAGERLKLIASFGAGVDHIDVASAHARGITVTNTPGVLTEDTADMTMALILSVPRRLAEGERLMRSGNWEGWGPTSMLGRRIWGKRLGIIGMGRIGTAVARRARGFGVSIHITTAAGCRTPSKPSSRRPIGRASIRCWRAWTSSRSIARILRPPTICSRRAASGSCSRTPISSTPRAARSSTRRH